MNIITLKDKIDNKKYDHILDTEIIFDHENKEIVFCEKDDIDGLVICHIFDIDGKEVHFWETERMSFDLIKDMAKVIDIHVMESDQQYMKDNGEHAKGCQGCDFEQDNVNNEPCSSCVDFCNYTPKNKPLEPLLMFSVGELYFMAYPGHTGDQVHDYFRANDLNNITTTPEKINAAKKELIKIINSKEVKVTDPETLDNTVAITHGHSKNLMNEVAGPLFDVNDVLTTFKPITDVLFNHRDGNFKSKEQYLKFYSFYKRMEV